MPQCGELGVLGGALLLVGLAAAQHLGVVLLLVVEVELAARALSVRMRSSRANWRCSSWLGVNTIGLSSRLRKSFSGSSVFSRRTATSRNARSSRFAPRLKRRPSIISNKAVKDSE